MKYIGYVYLLEILNIESNSSKWANGGMFALILSLAFVIIISFNRFSFKSKDNKERYLDRNIFKDIDKRKLDKYDIDTNEFKKMAYSRFLDIQAAKSSFDYDKISTLTTNELFNTLKMQLENLSNKKYKNIISEFSLVDSKITAVKEENNVVIVTMFLEASMYDYTVDSDDNIIRGSKDDKLSTQYIIKFVKSIKDNENICPNCGAKIINTNQNVCKYCRSKIITTSNKFVISSINTIGKRSVE